MFMQRLQERGQPSGTGASSMRRAGPYSMMPRNPPTYWFRRAAGSYMTSYRGETKDEDSDGQLLSAEWVV